MRRRLPDWALSLVGALAILSAWELASWSQIIHPVFYPRPSAILARGADLLTRPGGLRQDVLTTIVRLLLVAAVAAVPGILVGLAMSWSRWIARGIGDVLAFLFPIPSLLLLPILTFVLGRGDAAIILAAAITPFIVMSVATASGVRQIPVVLIEAARNYGAHGRKYVTRLLLPGALEPILSAVRVALGLSLIGVIAMEMAMRGDGLGGVLWVNWSMLRVTDMYVALIAIAFLGFAASNWFETLMTRMLPWQQQAA